MASPRTLLHLLDLLEDRPDLPLYRRRGRYGVRTRTRGQVREAALRLAVTLRDLGLATGERVLIQGPDGPEWCAAFLGVVAAGGVAVPLESGASASFVREAAERAHARAAVVWPGESATTLGLPEVSLPTVLALAADEGRWRRPPLSPDDPAEIVFTSGTTRTPRGVRLSHGNLLAWAERLERGFEKRRGWLRWFLPFRILDLVPLSHMFGQALGLVVPILFRSTSVFVDRPTPNRTLQWIRLERPLAVVLAPRMLASLTDLVRRRAAQAPRRRHAGRPPSRRFWRRVLSGWRVRRVVGWRTWVFVTGGAPLPAEVAEFWSSRGFLVVQGYGLTEAAPIVSVHNPLESPTPTLGRPLANVEIRLSPEGEILVRGPNVMQGYLGGDAAETYVDEDGWLHTGDLASLDSDGRLVYRGRRKDVIVTPSGRNVYPEDVEAVLRRAPGVRDAAVFALPDEEAGGDTVAAAVLGSGGPLDVEQVRAWAHERLEAHQRIHRIFAWPEEDFPRTQLGKIRRGEVARRLTGPGRAQAPAVQAHGLHPAVLRALRRVRRDVADLPSGEVRLGAHLGLDSLEVLEFLDALEDETGAELPDSLALQDADLRTIEDLVRGSRTGDADVFAPRMPRWSRWRLVRLVRGLLRETVVQASFRLFVRLRREGRPPAKHDAPMLIVANHTSMLDVPAVLLALPRPLRGRLAPAMAVETLPSYFDPGARWSWRRWWEGALYLSAVLLFQAYPLPQSRGFRPSLAYTVELVDAGLIPLIFPEGRMQASDHPGPFKQGIGRILQEAGCSVLPVHLSGLHRILPPKGRIPRPGTATVRFGHPVRLPDSLLEDPQGAAERLRLEVVSLASSSAASRSRT